MKPCSRCKSIKPLEDFYADKKRKDGRQSYCKECAKDHFKKWSDKKPETRLRHAEWKRSRRDESRKKYLAYMDGKLCVDCGISDWRVLEFDHVTDDKVAGVLAMVNRGSTWEKILEEISKCEIRCKNCHSLKTAERGGWWITVL